MRTKNREEIEAAIRALSYEEIAVEHNEGTFSSAECLRATGSGDTSSGVYTIYERVGDGRRRAEGCNPVTAPGRARYGRGTLDKKKAQLAELKQQLIATK